MARQVEVGVIGQVDGTVVMLVLGSCVLGLHGERQRGLSLAFGLKDIRSLHLNCARVVQLQMFAHNCEHNAVLDNVSLPELASHSEITSVQRVLSTVLFDVVEGLSAVDGEAGVSNAVGDPTDDTAKVGVEVSIAVVLFLGIKAQHTVSDLALSIGPAQRHDGCAKVAQFDRDIAR